MHPPGESGDRADEGRDGEGDRNGMSADTADQRRGGVWGRRLRERSWGLNLDTSDGDIWTAIGDRLGGGAGGEHGGGEQRPAE